MLTVLLIHYSQWVLSTPTKPGYVGLNSSQPNSGGVGGVVKPYPNNCGLPGSPGIRGGGVCEAILDH